MKLEKRPAEGPVAALHFVAGDVDVVVWSASDGYFSLHPFHSANDEVHELTGVLHVDDGRLVVVAVHVRRHHDVEDRDERRFLSVDGGRTWTAG